MQRTGWILAGAKMLAAALLLGGCVLAPPPGKGSQAEQGYAAAAPIIQSLKYFRANRGAYPDALDELVPDYLPSEPMLLVSVKDPSRPFGYRRVDDGYELEFDDTGSGSSRCVYRPATDWHCVGLR